MVSISRKPPSSFPLFGDYTRLSSCYYLPGPLFFALLFIPFGFSKILWVPFFFSLPLAKRLPKSPLLAHFDPGISPTCVRGCLIGFSPMRDGFFWRCPPLSLFFSSFLCFLIKNSHKFFFLRGRWRHLFPFPDLIFNLFHHRWALSPPLVFFLRKSSIRFFLPPPSSQTFFHLS